MKALPWLLVTAGVGAAVYLLLKEPALPDFDAEDTVDNFAAGATRWGVKQRISGTTARVAGQAKEAFGAALGNDQVADQGVASQIGGALQDAAGRVAQGAAQAVHELNHPA